ncbi:MAG: hypothetical protein AAF720_06150 [Pseudomonadota bacterium]
MDNSNGFAPLSSWDLGSNFSLEFAGLALAILSFTGFTDKIETGLDTLRYAILRSLPIMRDGVVSFIPTPKNIRRNFHPLTVSALLFCGWVIIGFLIEGDTRVALFGSLNALLTLPLWKTAALIVVTPFVLYFLMTAMSLILFGSIYFALTAVWFVFWLLSRPPAGLTGTVSFALALLSLSSKYWPMSV